MKRQMTLFGTRAKEKGYFIHRDPQDRYQCFVERFCLRAKAASKSGHIDLQAVHKKAQNAWTEGYKGNEGKIEAYLALKENEKPFVR